MATLHVASSSTITDCDLSNSYKTVRLYCGRSQQNYYHYDPNGIYTYNSCYGEIFEYDKTYKYIVEELIMGDCKASRLSIDLSKQFPNLRSFDISHIGIEYLSSTDLYFKYLNKLLASNNQLANISNSLFVHLPDITDIDISFNQIIGLYSGDFKGNTKLSTILLSHNKITTLANDVFSPLINLISLDLNNNFIEMLHPDIFKMNVNLRTLLLDNNPIRRFDGNIFMPLFNSPSLELEVSCERVTEIDASFLATTAKIQLPKIRCIKESYKNLKYFNISGNHLENAWSEIDLLGSSIDTLDVSSNYLNTLKVDTCFEQHKELKYVDFSDTNLTTIMNSNEVKFQNSIKIINNKIEGHKKVLDVLKLDNNPIKELNCAVWFLMMSAASVSISWQNFEAIDTSCLKGSLQIQIDNDAFIFQVPSTKSEFRWPTKNLPNLKYVYIQNNQLNNTHQIIDHLVQSNVELLDVSGNFIGHINSSAFQRMSHLNYLYLCRTNLTNFHVEKSSNLNHLETLHIEENPISFVDCNLFSLLITVPKVDISWKNVRGIDTSCIGPSLQIDFNATDEITFRIPENGSRLAYGKHQFQLLTYLKVSNNRLQNTHELIQHLGTSVETLDLSSNFIGRLNASLFERFTELKYLNLSDTNLTTIDFISAHHLSFPEHNRKLMVLQLQNNPLSFIDCRLFLLVMQMPAVQISWANVRDLDTSCVKESVRIELNTDDVIFRKQNSEIRWNKKMFHQLTSLNVSGNRLPNAFQLVNSLGSTIEILDLTSNFVGNLSASTFQRFINLKVLHLSRTNLTNFGFNTFFHLQKLIELDISYNHLGQVNFTLFVRNFRHLTTLNIEGNDLMEIDTINHLNFPRLLVLAISKNRFSCNYLVMFLQRWENLQLVSNPSNQTHIDGVDCRHDDQQQTTQSLTNSPSTKISQISQLDCRTFEVSMNDTKRSGSCERVTEIDTSCYRDLLRIDINNTKQTLCYSISSKLKFCCTLKALQKITFLNISGNHLPNAVELIELLGPSIETLDLSMNYVGRLNASTFERFDRLKYLNLSNTNLTNFGFNTFFHQINLNVLDISYNRLGKVDFDLLFLNFKSLNTLNVEGNDLVAIDSITQKNFPQLRQLGISRNNLSCQYLANFIQQWKEMEIVYNPSNGSMHLAGVDCQFRNQSIAISTDHEAASAPSVMIFILMTLCVIFGIWFVVKSIERITERGNASENAVIYRPNDVEFVENSIK